MPRITVKLLLSIIYVGIVLLFAGFLFVRAQSFDGVIVVEQGSVERWAVQPAASGGFFSTAHRNMSTELIGFENPRAAIRVLGRTELFDAAPLPFRLRLQSVDVLERYPDMHTLEIWTPDDRRVIEAAPGAEFDIPEGAIVIAETAPWTGLVRDGRGRSLAALTAQSNDGTWTPPIFVGTDQVMRPWPGLALSLHWFDSEDTARDALPDALPELPAARWGVADNGRVHWFETLFPGAGVTTTDGVEYVLLEVIGEPTAPDAIVVGRREGDEAARITVDAGDMSPDGLIRFEAWRDAVIVLLHAWRDGAAAARYYMREDGVAGDIVVMDEGDVLEIPGPEPPLRIRLEQLMRTAVAVTGEEGDVTGLVVDTPDGVRRLREGQSIQLDETRLRYRRQPRPPSVRYTLHALFDEETVEFTLAPGKCRRIGAWRFCHDQDFLETERIAVLRATRVAGTPSRYLGALLLIIGVFGLCVLRFADWRRIDRTPPEDDNDELPWTEVNP